MTAIRLIAPFPYLLVVIRKLKIYKINGKVFLLDLWLPSDAR